MAIPSRSALGSRVTARTVGSAGRACGRFCDSADSTFDATSPVPPFNAAGVRASTRVQHVCCKLQCDGQHATKQLGDRCACRQTSLQKAINKQKERNPLLIYSAFCLDRFRSRLKPAEHVPLRQYECATDSRTLWAMPLWARHYLLSSSAHSADRAQRGQSAVLR